MTEADTPKRIAFITNGAPGAHEPELLEEAVRKLGWDVDVFNINSPMRAFNPKDYALVVRSIKGGTSGDTEKSLQLQERFERAGVRVQIGSEVLRTVTDKIQCIHALREKAVLTVSSVNVKDTGDLYIERILGDVKQQLGGGPYLLKKSTGSGPGAVRVAKDARALEEEIEKFPRSVKIKNGLVVQPMPPLLTKELIERYELKDIDSSERRPYHYRVVAVDGKIFGANLYYSDPGTLSLNVAQGAHAIPINEAVLDTSIKTLAKKALAELGLRLGAVDIVVDEDGRARVLDMNPSPDLSFRNFTHESLRDAVAADIVETAMGRGSSMREAEHWRIGSDVISGMVPRR